MKTVVVGWDGNLYLTDGHHSFSALRARFDGGPKLPVWVRSTPTTATWPTPRRSGSAWSMMRKAWLRDGRQSADHGGPVAQAAGPGQREAGMQEDRYRSLVYFTRDIAYANGGLPEFAEFLWGDWLRRQRRPVARVERLQDDSARRAGKHPGRQQAGQEFAAHRCERQLLGRGARRRRQDGGAGRWRRGSRIGPPLSSVASPGCRTPPAAPRQRDALEELPRNDIKAPGSPPRNGGKLCTRNYRNCGKPAAGTCWGW